jgi:predicted HTH transcriptional regulator
MGLQPWADPAFSQIIPTLRGQGEGQQIEFKVEFPDDAGKIAKSVAGFATSGEAWLLIGVEKNGALVGVPARTEKERDDLILRAQGIIQTVRPLPKCEIFIGEESGNAVLGIHILKQDHPVFYYEGRPYVRDGRQSRRAEPDEVVELVWAHPSSEHKREMEKINRELVRTLNEDTRALNQQFANSLMSGGPSA